MTGMELTQTEMAAHDLCKLHWSFKFHELLATKKRSVHLDFGSVVHHGLEAFYREDPDPIGKAEEYAKGVKEQAEASGIPPGDSYYLTLRTAKCYLEAYIHEVYKDDFDKYRVISVEPPFEVRHPMDKSIVVRGKFDIILSEKSGGRLLIGEHKTVSQWDSDINRLMLDWQVSVYAWSVSRLLRIPEVTFLYNVLKKPGIKPKENESEEEYLVRLEDDLVERKDFYFHRDFVKRSKSEIERVEKEIYYKAQDIERSRSNPETITRTTGDHCQWKCGFREVCLENTQAMRDAMYVVREEKYPELAI